jgi:serine/threonine protein phosphatase PrpC
MLVDLSLLNPLSMALLVLAVWVALCLLLVLPLVVSPFFHWWQARGQARKSVSGARSQSASDQREMWSPFPARADALPVLLPAWSQPDKLSTRQPAPKTPQPTWSNAYTTHRRQDTLPTDAQPLRSSGMEVSALTEGGRIQTTQENEDSFLTITGARSEAGQLHPFGLFVVADGVSGYATGREASGATISAIVQRFVPVLTQQELPDEDLPLLLAASIQSANTILYQHNQRHLHPFGCTVTAALVSDQKAAICNVGKNRAYLLTRQAPLRRVTVDHSIVESLVVAGFIQRDEVYTHPRKNRIYRCLGQGPQVEIDTVHLPAAHGDQLLFCSDGLWELVRDPDMERVLRQSPDTRQASSKLVALAKEHGGLDDITAILVKLSAAPEPAPRRPGIIHIDSNVGELAL